MKNILPTRKSRRYFNHSDTISSRDDKHSISTRVERKIKPPEKFTFNNLYYLEANVIDVCLVLKQFPELISGIHLSVVQALRSTERNV